MRCLVWVLVRVCDQMVLYELAPGVVLDGWIDKTQKSV